MKKIIVSAFMLAAIATSAAYAQEVKTTTPVATETTQQDKTKVEPDALPQPVKTTLAGEAYKDWKVASAWLVKATPEYYVVELKKEDKTNTVNIDKDGQVK